MSTTVKRDPDRAQFLSDVIVTAVEGGINYWADIRSYRWYSPDLSGGTAEHEEGIANAYATIRELGHLGHTEAWGGTFEITLDTIQQALSLVRSAVEIKHLGEGMRKGIVLADRSNGEEGDMDADMADVIVQLACFGEVVYG